MKGYFYALAEEIGTLLRPGEVFTCHLIGEESDFVRLNRNRVRQAGHVRQIEVALDLIEGARHASARFNLGGEMKDDRSVLREQVRNLRTQRADLPDDAYLLYATVAHNSEDYRKGRLPPSDDAVTDIVTAAEGLDLVGYLASGTQYQGFANSFGQRNWFESVSFNLDWSCHEAVDQAVKSSYAGFEWDVDELHRRVEEAGAQLNILSGTPRTLEPGRYRAYLAPAALHEILDRGRRWIQYQAAPYDAITAHEACAA